MSVQAVLRSEWLKIRSVRALLVALLSGLVATAGISALVGATAGDHDDPDFDPVFFSFFGLNFGQIAALCFGVLAVAGEYRGGGIRVWLAAVPRRGLYYAGKLAVVGALALAVGTVTGFVSLFTGQALLGAEGVGPGAPGALRAAFGCGLYLALLTLMASGAATVLRSAVGALGLLVPFVCFLSPVLGTGPVIQYLPDQAGQQMLHAHPEGALGPWTGLAVMAAWSAVAVWAGWRALERRDA